MAPTIHQGRVIDRGEKRTGSGRSDRRSDLVCRVKYSNTLPDIPFDPKFINYPFSSNRYVQYKPTSLEKNYKYEVLTEHDLGVAIDLINPDAYKIHPGQELHPTDEKLLEDDVLMPQGIGVKPWYELTAPADLLSSGQFKHQPHITSLTVRDAKRSRHHHVNVSWLRRTEYISTEMTRYQPQTMEKIEATVGFSTRRKAKQVDENVYTDRESQLEAIEKTFEDVKKPVINHYSKPGVTAVEELSIFPDFDLWKYPCAQVIFDSDPAPIGRPIPAQLEEMSQAMIRGVMDESGEQFVAYFLPTEETRGKRKRDKESSVEYVDEEEYEYTMAREYNWNVKNKASKGYEENYFFVLRDEGVFYNELETRVRLSKRRMKQGHAPNNSRLVVNHRPLNAQEHKTQRYREKMLEPPCEEEEEEEEEEETLPVDDDDAASRSRSGSRSKSRSRSRSGSSRSSSRSRSRSKSGSRSRSGTPKSRSGSSRSRSGSPRSRSGTPKSRSGSPRSRSGTPKSRSGSPRSRSGTPKSRSGSPRSRSGTPRSGSGSPRSRSGTPRSRSASKSSDRSRSRSRSSSPANSEKSSASGSSGKRSRSSSPESPPAKRKA